MTLKIFLKGCLMGISDIIPGVSGGTMAFILGIYERLINSIKNLNLNFLFSNRKKNLLRMDLGFLIPLGLGIIISFLIGSKFIPFLLDNYPQFIFSFFFGLILGSIYLIKKEVKVFKIKYFLISIIAFIFAFIISGMKEISGNHSYIFIFFSGMIAIIAMLLPGISGSFVLLLLGQYKFMLEALREIKISIIFVFLSGAVLGLLISSRLISYLLKRFHNPTIFALLGLMFGGLRVPFVNVVYVNTLYPKLEFIWSFLAIFLIVLFFLLGIIVVVIIGKFERDKI